MEPLFARWESYYVIVGTSAAALTGLQFVVMALAADRRIGTEGTTRAFATPNIVHFSTVLLISGIFSAPWHSTQWPTLLTALCGLAGVVYVISVIRTARRQHDYEPVLEDIIWHWVLPLVAYGALTSVALAPGHLEGDLFAIGGAALGLLFIGIHNAWDSATFITHRRASEE